MRAALKVLLLAAGVLLPGCLQPIAAGCGVDGFACCEGSTCEANLTCAPEGLCRPCGADGQSCCDARQCGLGAECRDDNLCHDCGAEGQACCRDASCGGGLRCDNATCVRPCGASCAPGELRCSATGGVDLCSYGGYPCTQWSPIIEKCPQDQACSAGVCGDLCPGACALNSGICTTEGLKVCVYDPETRCPVYQVAPPSSDLPSCLVGPCDQSICWESPLPLGGTMRAMAGSPGGQLYLLDAPGNIARGSDQTWVYDRRTYQGSQRLSAIAHCGIESKLLGVGTSGAVFRRVASEWAVENVGDASVNLHGVACHFGRFSLAVGDGGRIFVRDSNGAWRSVASPTTKTLRSVAIHFVREEAWAVGDLGTLVHCTDLEQRNGPTQCVLEGADVTTASLADVAVAGNQSDPARAEVFAVGQNGTVLRRPVGTIGIWELEAPGLLAQDLSTVDALDDGSVYIGGGFGEFASRIAAGMEFEVLRFSDQEIVGLFALDSTHLYALTSGAQVWFSATRGQSSSGPSVAWRQIGGRQPTTATLFDIDGLLSDDMYAVGEGGVVLHKTGDVWRPEAQGLATANLRSVTVVSAQEVYAVGADGVILAKRDGVWSREGAGVTSHVLFGVFNDGLNVYAVGTGGTWLEKPVGSSGSLWHRVPQAATTANLYAVAGQRSATGPGSSEVWAVGADCTVLRKQNGSFATFNLPNCSGQELFGLSMESDGEIYVVGPGGFVRHRQGGSWASAILEFANFNAVASSANTVVVVGEEGELHLFSGSAWQRLGFDLTWNSLQSVALTQDGRMFIVGSGGLIWHGN